MVGTDDLLIDRQGPLIEGLRLPVAALIIELYSLLMKPICLIE